MYVDTVGEQNLNVLSAGPYLKEQFTCLVNLLRNFDSVYLMGTKYLMKSSVYEKRATSKGVLQF